MVDSADPSGTLDWDAITKVIVAGSVHERKHPKGLEVFLLANRDNLNEKDCLLLSVSLSAAFPEGQADAQDYVDEMKMRTGFEPDTEKLVGGAVRTAHYDFYASQVVRHVILRGRVYDPNLAEHEFTDWDDLRTTVASFLKR